MGEGPFVAPIQVEELADFSECERDQAAMYRRGFLVCWFGSLGVCCRRFFWLDAR